MTDPDGCLQPVTEKDLERLDLLLGETAEARDDDRYLFAQYAVLIGAAVVVITALASVFYFTCSESRPSCRYEQVTMVSDWIYVGTPLLPIALIGYTIFISTIAALRSYYLRAIELEIHQLTHQRDSELRIPSWSHVTLEVAGQSHAGGIARLNLFLVYGIVLLMVAECVCLSYLKIYDLRLKVFALTTDVVLMAVLLAAAVLNVARGSLIWEAALEGLPERLRRTESGFQFPARQKDERSLASFLLLPRNQEELLKAFFIPICFGIRWLTPGVSHPSLEMIGYSAAFFFVFEFIMYQGRYLLNDVRDRKDDCKEGPRKQRFPCSWMKSRRKENQALTAAFASFAARWVLAGLIVGCLLPIDYVRNWKWLWHAGFLLAIFVIASLYEAARTLCRTWAVAASDEFRVWRTKQVCTWVVILLVGLGYGLRATVGLWLAGADYRTLEYIAVGASLFGSTFVALTWALESTKTKDREELTRTKPHLLWFRDLIDVPVAKEHVTADRDLIDVPLAKKHVTADEKVLTGWQSPLAPWTLSAILATVALAYFTVQLFPGYRMGPCGLVSTAILVFGLFLPLPIAWLVATLGFIFWCVTLRSVPMSIRSGLATLIPGHPGIVTFICSILAALIPSLPLLVTCSFRRMCYNDLPGAGDKLRKLAASIPLSIYRWFAKPRKQLSIFHRVPLRRLKKPEDVRVGTWQGRSAC
jgi:hypothetical protein